MIIQTDNLHKKFGKHAALDGLSLAVPEGSAFALIGANGAGKTTTIKLLMNLLTATSGSATVLGVDSRHIGPRELASIGYVSENQEVPKQLTVGHYLDYLRPFYPAWDRQLESSLLQQLGLPLDRRIGDLSRGMRMKMLLLCAMAFRPKLLVLDEPFTGLDPLVRDEFMQEVFANAGDMTVFISSHDLVEIEGLVTHVAFVEKGRVLFQEAMETLASRVREVHVTLATQANESILTPPQWLQVRAHGNVLSFVDTGFDEQGFHERISSQLADVRHIDIHALPLRSIFTTYARAAQRQGGTP